MKIKKLILKTNKLEQEKAFYCKKLNFQLIEDTTHYFTLNVGWTTLSFITSEVEHIYHYCFLIPSNKLHEALKWMKERVDIIDIENGREIQRFESWNAESFYFFDGSGNLAEFIVRHDLKNDSPDPFDTSSILCVNEIGMPTTNIETTNEQLEAIFQSSFWKGDYNRFGTHGSQEGLILLPSHSIKGEWFPSKQLIKPETFDITIEHKGMTKQVSYNNERINVL